ncbi:MAG: hypothetical protein PHC88_16970, partial [Terrimicrobiaceae bacterium]|nr:hypothetical protein [Terrimicrobiaceae bacterium]
ALLAGAALVLTASIADARPYGVSSYSAGRGTAYTTSRGGSAYVGPRGFAAQGADGRTAAVTQRGAAYSGPNGAAYATTRPGFAPLPGGYVRTVPVGAQPVVYGGYNCYYAAGVYYRPVFYGGSTVYVAVP